ncbi:uncharacterized protein LACBIDRAFT_305203 [Laccaria bicolor S238N-H82]|uniref:Predicted protein n=1 Tax=Laccaria bicolor (strain S238N-H82 / ATCC MYA-4686) TaxID=486041 RepID=B0CTN5_LACBS|nr:uncharacterized protein LACBIDRAFT_305203 [Laccaria bicolor S238N-H82]EDR13951.1 predicted protein [Laccaria bicolor S238N-H82]|eukprot:XP_001874510.1 predicted protein [Laccaria bicolor S238N-H82]
MAELVTASDCYMRIILHCQSEGQKSKREKACVFFYKKVSERHEIQSFCQRIILVTAYYY